MEYDYSGLPSTSYDNSQALTLVQPYSNQLQPYAPQPGPSSLPTTGSAPSSSTGRNVPAFLNKLYRSAKSNDPHVRARLVFTFCV